MSSIHIQARKIERTFIRKCKKHLVTFETGTGKQNQIQKIMKGKIRIVLKSTNHSFDLNSKSLRKAITYFLVRRTVVRKDLEQFSAFSSSLFGLLHSIFVKVTKVQKTVRGLLRLTLKGLRFWFSGVDRCLNDLKLIQKNGGKWVLGTYFHLRNRKSSRWREHLQHLGLQMFLDSGALSVHKAERYGKYVEPINIEEYALFVKANMSAGILYAYLNLDVFGDPAASKRNFQYLTKLVGVPPVPIYHVTSPIEELEAIMKEDHELIALGASAFIGRQRRETLVTNIVHSYTDQNFHLLGCGSSLLYKIDLFSADAHTWISGRKYQKLITPIRTIEEKDWTVEKCLSHNISQLVKLENPMIQVELDMIHPSIV